MHIEILLVGLSLALGLAGCQTAQQAALVAPISRVNSLGLTGSTGLLKLCFTNPNPVPLVVTCSTHQLKLGDKSIGTIDDEEPIGLPPFGTVEHSVVLNRKITLAAQGYLNNTPGPVYARVNSQLVLIFADDDFFSIKSMGSGLVHAP
jgi:hypothetical protein